MSLPLKKLALPSPHTSRILRQVATQGDMILCASSLPLAPVIAQGVNIAYLVALLCYFGVTIAGYAVFGNAVAGNVLESIGQPLSLISLAEMCVVLHVAASCQVN
jgi:hypothetical protein